MTRLTIATSEFQSQVADLLPSNKHKRSQLTHALIKSLSLLDEFDEVLKLPICSRKDLLQFHSSAYVDAILDENLNAVLPFEENDERWSQLPELAASWGYNEIETQWHESRSQLLSQFKKIRNEVSSRSKKRSALDALLQDEDESGKVSGTHPRNLKQFNLEGDCPLFSFMPMYCQVITGATLMLADSVFKEQRSIGINWDGGRHHAFKQRASGFCYVNDIVLLILKLRSNGFNKISYVDFDLHHGDGVERAFQFSSNVQTISLHMLEVGFFPGTGNLSESNGAKGVVNIPLLHGLDDCTLEQLNEHIIKPLLDRHDPDVLVIQCGGDGLMGDGFNEWQLSIRGLAKCITELIECTPDRPVILLGGGGYNVTLMSRFYAYLTWKVVKAYGSCTLPLSDISADDALIPDHEFIDVYADEEYNFWAYEQEGGLRKKHLKNDNSENLISSLKNHYKV